MGKARGKWQRLVLGLVAAAIVFAAAVPAHAGEAVVLGRVCIRDIKGLLEKAGKVADKFVPGQGAQVVAMAGMALQGAEWAGIDWSKPVTVALLSGKSFGKAEPVVVGIFPVANGEQFRQARQAAGRANEAVEIRGNYALLSDTKAAFETITERRINIYSTFPDVGADADVYLTGYVADALKEYQPELDKAMQEAQGQMAGMGAAGPFAAIANFQKAVVPLAKFAGAQVRRVSLILKLSADNLDISGRLYAIEGGQLAAGLAAQPATPTDLAKYLPRDVAMGMTANLDMTKMRPFIEAGLDAVAGPMDMKAEDRQKLLDLMFGSTYTGEFAAAYSANPAHKGMQIAQVVKATDEAKFRAATQNALDWFKSSPLAAMVQGAGLKMDWKAEPGIREHNGVTIDRFTMTMKPAEGAAPNPMMGQQPPQVTEHGFLNGLGVAATNNPTGDLLNGIIDRIKGGEPGLDQSPAYKQAAAAANNAPVVFHAGFNTLVAKFIEEIAKAQPMIAMMAGGIAKADPNEAPITGYVTFAKDRMEFSTRVPQQPIVNFATRARMMMQQMRGGAQPGAPQPQPGPDF